MRSAVLAGLVLLAGCQGPQEKPAEAVTASSPAAQRFQALGTEPFWSIDVLPGQLRYSSPEILEGTTFAATESKDGQASRYSGTMDGKPLSLTIAPGTCSDGMSDTVYDWKAVLTIDGKTEQGCARLK